MKTKNFNKFSGTELRVKNILGTYFQLVMWLKDQVLNNDYKFKINELENKFIKFCEEEGIYSYKKGKISRLGMFISTLQKIGFLTKKANYCFLNKQYIEENSPNSSFFKAILEGKRLLVFNNMISFINKTKNIKTIPLFLAFSTCEENDNFQNLYELFLKCGNKNDSCKYIAENITEKNLLNINEYKEKLNYRKPNNIQKICKKILDYKMNNIIIEDSFFDKQTIKEGEKFFKEFQNTKNIELNSLIFKINNSSIKDFIFKLEFFRIKNLLLKEYFDVWFRWMKDMHFLNTKKDEYIFKDHLKSVEDTFEIQTGHFLLEKYPYSLEEVNIFLKEISHKDFNNRRLKLLNKYEKIKNINSSTLAEYFVNLKYSYIFKIPPKEFKKYSNTIVDDDLQPIYTAPGRQSDFSYFNSKENILINVETTLLDNYSALFKNEVESNIRHILKDAVLKNINKLKKIELKIVTPFLDEETNLKFKNLLNFEFKNSLKVEIPNSLDFKVDEVQTFFELADF